MYKLVDKVPVECGLDDFGRLDRADRGVARTVLPSGSRVSTVFLGLDHQWGDGPPLLFETMVFPEDDFAEEDMDRYSTWEEAVEGHRNMVEKHGGTVTPKDFFDDDLFEM